MAEPFSVAGSAVGVVSLGLTVCQGLIKYFSEWKSRESDVHAAIDQINGLTQTLELLQARLAKLPGGHETVTANVESRIASCGEGIENLSRYLDKCHTFGTQADWKGKMRASKKQLFYPFRREALQDVKQTLRDLQQNLETALEPLCL